MPLMPISIRSPHHSPNSSLLIKHLNTDNVHALLPKHMGDRRYECRKLARRDCLEETNKFKGTLSENDDLKKLKADCFQKLSNIRVLKTKGIFTLMEALYATVT